MRDIIFYIVGILITLGFLTVLGAAFAVIVQFISGGKYPLLTKLVKQIEKSFDL